MFDDSKSTQIEITEDMVERGLEFFVHFSIDLRATETTYPEFVVDLLNYIHHGKAPWPTDEEPALAPAEAD
jgi:hypothetical protein